MSRLELRATIMCLIGRRALDFKAPRERGVFKVKFDLVRTIVTTRGGTKNYSG